MEMRKSDSSGMGRVGLRRALVLAAAVLVMWACFCSSAFADTLFSIPAEYNQEEARRMLGVVNAYRAENGVHALQYDYTLEAFAMQRAAEIGVLYSHQRPDGSSVSEDLKTVISGVRSMSASENIFRSGGDGTAESAVSVFAGSAAHNEAMLSSAYNYCGFGYACVDRYWCWVQIFHSATGNASYTTAATGLRYVNVPVRDDLIRLGSDDGNYIYVNVYDECDRPQVYRMVGDVRFPCDLNWSVADSSVAGFSSEGMIGGISAGQTTVTAASMYGETISFNVLVNPFYLSNYNSDVTVTLSQKSYTYTGSEIRPVPVVKVKGQTLRSGTDYTLSYENNKEAGSGYIRVTGKGNFGGDCGTSFDILKAKQQVTASISPSTVTAGGKAKITAKGLGSLSYASKAADIAYTGYDGTVYTYESGKTGTAVITVTASGDQNHLEGSTTVTVTVKAAPSSSSSSSAGTGTGTSGTTKTAASSGTNKTSGTSGTTKTNASSGNSAASKTSSLKAPVITRAASVKGGIRLRWKKVNGAAKYRVMYRTGKSSFRTVCTTRALTCLWTPPSAGVKYYLTVRAVDAKGRPSRYYNKIGKRAVYVAVPSLRSIKSPGGRKLKVTWKKAAGAGGYQIAYNLAGKKAKYKVVKKAGTVSAWLKKLKKGKKYTVRIRAYRVISGTKYYSAWSAAKTKKVK